MPQRLKRKKYRVHMTFRFTDTIELKARDKDEAEKMALEMSEPSYDTHLYTITKEC